MEKNYKKLGYLNETALSLFFKFNTRIKEIYVNIRDSIVIEKRRNLKCIDA